MNDLIKHTLNTQKQLLSHTVLLLAYSRKYDGPLHQDVELSFTKCTFVLELPSLSWCTSRNAIGAWSELHQYCSWVCQAHSWRPALQHSQLLRKISFICTTWAEQALKERTRKSPSCGLRGNWGFLYILKRLRAVSFALLYPSRHTFFSPCIPDHWWKPPGIYWLPLQVQLYVE